MSNTKIKTPVFRMQNIPGGEIMMRDDRTQRQWKVDIQPFSLAEFPVTQELYSSITQNNPASFPAPENPVETVSWYDAVSFCNRLSLKEGFNVFYLLDTKGHPFAIDDKAKGYRLPSEAEWQYACHGGIPKSRYGDLDNIAWYKDNSGGMPHAAGLKKPNLWGLYDMLGNVWEWCEDLYNLQEYGEYRVFRGGGWNDSARGCLATNRRRGHPSFKIDDLGFRIARFL